MIKPIALISFMVFGLAVAPQSSSAQEKSSMIDLKAVMKAGEAYLNPAAFVLAHRKELALTDAQVKSIDSLGKADPFDLMEYARPDASETAMGAMLMDLSVPIDSVVIRRGVQSRVDRETKMMLDRARSTRRLQLLLTPIQRTALITAQMRSSFDLIDGSSPETKH